MQTLSTVNSHDVVRLPPSAGSEDGQGERPPAVLTRRALARRSSLTPRSLSPAARYQVCMRYGAKVSIATLLWVARAAAAATAAVDDSMGCLIWGYGSSTIYGIERFFTYCDVQYGWGDEGFWCIGRVRPTPDPLDDNAFMYRARRWQLPGREEGRSRVSADSCHAVVYDRKGNCPSVPGPGRGSSLPSWLILLPPTN